MPACLIAGVLGAHLFTALPPAWLIAVVSVISGSALLSARIRVPAIGVLACCWCLVEFHRQLDERLDPTLAGAVMSVTGRVSSLPAVSDAYLRFQFEPERNSVDSGLPRRLLVYWYRDWPEVLVGQQWRLELKLKPPWAAVNFQGADREKWLFAQGIGGQGIVRSGELTAEPPGFRFLLQSVRESVTLQLRQRLADERQRSMVQALAVADRSDLKPEDRRLLRATGTAHLLAISGLHVGLAAAGGIWLGRVLLWMSPWAFTGKMSFAVSTGVGLLVAALYAGLAGFEIPTLRAVVMLAIFLLALSLRRTIHPMRAWLVAFTAILLLDPFAPLGAGFWFSFMAVAALSGVFLPRTGRTAWWQVPMMAQAGVMLVLLPLSAALFHSFSPSGFFSNLAAIPWVSVFVVPPVLMGIAVLPVSDTLAGLFWSFAGSAALLLLQFLEIVFRLQGPAPTLPQPSALQVAVALMGSGLLLLPRGLRVRWAGILLLAPLFFPVGERTESGSLELEVLDVGQGTAVLISTPEESMLYDTGPGDGEERNYVAGIIAPALARLGSGAPERVVISHGDLDHAGGTGTVTRLFPQAEYAVNPAGDHSGFDACTMPLNWNWGGAQFEVLHPSPGLPYLGNDSSCVISIRAGEINILMTGDISSVIENRLIREGIAPHKVLLVPHHGSETSSSAEFVDAIRPEIAIATASLGNRFNFPRPTVRKRYESAGSAFWSTGECGALRLQLLADGSVQVRSARRQRNRIWRWPAAANCP